MNPLPSIPRNPDGAAPLSRAARALRVQALATLVGIAGFAAYGLVNRDPVGGVCGGLAFLLYLGWAASTYAMARRLWRDGTPLEAKIESVEGRKVRVAFQHVDGNAAHTLVKGAGIEGASLKVLVDPTVPTWCGVLLNAGMVMGRLAR